MPAHTCTHTPLQMYHNKNFPVTSLGFTSIIDLLSSLTVCDLVRPSGTGDWIAFAKGKGNAAKGDN